MVGVGGDTARSLSPSCGKRRRCRNGGCRNGGCRNGGCRRGFRGVVLRLLPLWACLLWKDGFGSTTRGGSPRPLLAALAFATPTTLARGRRTTARPESRGFGLGVESTPPQRRPFRTRTGSVPTKSNTALHFFSILSNNNNNNNDSNNNNNNNPDLPLARYVDVSANYTLAHTPQDYIDLQENQRLVCIGDVHGDLEALRAFLETAGVYHRQTDSWCGGNTIVVQCGDILDRGFEELACYRLLSKLSQQAPTQKGRVVLLIGNHEALNAMGLFQYAYSDIEHEQSIGVAVDEVLGEQNKWRNQYVNNQPARWASYEPGGLLAHSLMRNMKVAIRVGKTVCVHAGLTPGHLKDHGGIPGMNASFREWISLGDDLGLLREDFLRPEFPNPVVYNHHGNYPPGNPRQAWIDAEKRQQFYVNSIPPFLRSDGPGGATGPVWMRDYSSPHDEPPVDDARGTLATALDTTLALLDADRMVMGHTIQRRINGVFSGKAWRVDVGASRGCLSGTPEVLEVVCVRGPDGGLSEEVSVLTPVEGRIPEADRLVDSYTQAALQML